jgi:tungstate transport system permease protein
VIAANPYHEQFFTGLRDGFDLLVSGNQTVIDTTVRTLRLAAVATGLAALVGLPLGCLLGLGRSRPLRWLERAASATTRIPPVAVGMGVALLVREASPWGGGPLAALGWQHEPPSAYLAQSLLAVPIVTALTAAAVRKVPGGLLEQARAFGASRWRCGALSLREARRSVFAALLVALAVTITAIGALGVVNASPGVNRDEPATLATGAFAAFHAYGGGADRPPPGTDLASYPSYSLGVAYATLLFGLFVLISVALTLLQQRQRRRTSWIPGLQS